MMNGQTKTFSAKYLGGGNTTSLVNGDIYTAYDVKGVTKLIGVVDRYGEEYAFPAKWFERVDAEPSPLILFD